MLLDTMFELVVNGDCIMRKAEPLLIYVERKEGAASAS